MKNSPPGLPSGESSRLVSIGLEEADTERDRNTPRALVLSLQRLRGCFEEQRGAAEHEVDATAKVPAELVTPLFLRVDVAGIVVTRRGEEVTRIVRRRGFVDIRNRRHVLVPVESQTRQAVQAEPLAAEEVP